MNLSWLSAWRRTAQARRQRAARSGVLRPRRFAVQGESLEDRWLLTSTFVHFETSEGPIRAELFSDTAPLTVQNFLSYVNSGKYNSSILHRSIPGFVVQGGGFHLDTPTNMLSDIPASDPVNNEFQRSNVRGTMAMAKVPDNPNSATKEWFFNLADNGGTPPDGLDFQNGGFTVFGQVLGNGMSVVDAIAGLPWYDLTPQPNTPFENVPLRFELPPNATMVPVDYWVTISSVSVVPNAAPLLFPILDRAAQPGTPLTFTPLVVDIDAPHERLTYSLGAGAPQGASINPNSGEFTWNPAGNQTGLHRVSIQVVDTAGLSASRSFGIAVGDLGSPVIASIADVSPSPRTTPVDQMTISFSTPVTGFGLASLQLTRNGGANLLTGAQALATSDNQTWTLGNLTDLTRAPGNYQLTLTASASNIQGSGGQLLQVGTSKTFSIDGVNLGTLRQQVVPDLNVSAGELWYRFTTGLAGTLTLDTTFSGDPSSVGLTLFDDTFTQSTESTATAGMRRIDQQVPAGKILYARVTGSNTDVQLRLTNAVEQSSATVRIHGTTGADQFTFGPEGTNLGFTINGVHYMTDPAINGIFNFTGEGKPEGQLDSIVMVGSPSGNRAQLQPGGGSVTGANFIVNLSAIQNINITGSNANDRADLNDSSGDDHLVFATNGALMTGTDFSLQVSQFPIVRVVAGTGFDRADFTGTATGDQLVVRPDLSLMASANFYRSAQNFDVITAAAAAANSTAVLYGTAGDDQVGTTLSAVQMSGGGRQVVLNNFSTLRVIGGGGTDTALVTLPDNPNLDSQIVISPQMSLVRTAGVAHYFSGFERVLTQAVNGNHVATVYGTPGNDILDAAPGAVQLGTSPQSGALGFRALVTGAKQVRVFGAGGDDTAVLRGNSSSDQFFGTAGSSQLVSSNTLTSAEDFRTLRVYGRRGTSVAVVMAPVSAAQPSHLEAAGNLAALTGPDFGLFLYEFSRVVATAGTAQDTLHQSAIDYVLQRQGNWIVQ